jgi:hypothetical protein
MPKMTYDVNIIDVSFSVFVFGKIFNLDYNDIDLFDESYRGAALLVGLWDLLIHSMVLCALIFMFRQSPPPSPSGMMKMDEQNVAMPMIDSPYAEPPKDMLEENPNFRSSKILLNRILEKRNMTHIRPVGLNTRNFYSHLDLMTIKWAASLNRRMRNSY